MDLVRLVEHAKPKLRAPVFIEGLPGVGHVGKLAAQQLVATTGAKPWCDIYSKDFPPQVTVGADGTAKLVRCQLWTVAGKGKEPPLVIMTGDAQPLSSHGQYEMVEAVLAKLEALGCKEIYTLGGFGTGTRVEKPDVMAAASSKAAVQRVRKLGIRIPGDDEEGAPGGGIIGASGLFLGLGALRGMEGVCLMGETNGYMVDPKAARAVLEALGKCLGRTLDLGKLEDRARDLDRITAQLHAAVQVGKDGTDHYIG